jgi:hypothetical protein
MNFLYFLAFAIGAEACTIRLRHENLNTLSSHLPMYVSQTCGSSFDVLAIEIVDSDLPYLPMPLSAYHHSVFDNFVNLRSLTLRNCQLESLYDYDFDRLWNLRSLSLEGNSLSSLSPRSLDQLRSLISLDLSHNQFTSLDSSLFAHMSSLQHLELNGNNLPNLDEAAFVGLDSLMELDLSQNQLSSLPAHVFDPLTQLQSLTLSDDSVSGQQEHSNPSCSQPVVGATQAGACRAVQDSNHLRSVGFVVRAEPTEEEYTEGDYSQEYEYTEEEYSEGELSGDYSEVEKSEGDYVEEDYSTGSSLNRPASILPTRSGNTDLVALFVGILCSVFALASLAYFACFRSKTTTCATKHPPVTIDDLGNPVMLGDDEADPLLCVFTPSLSDPTGAMSVV